METTRCFLDDHDTRESRKKKQEPDMLRRSFSSDAQSASEKPRIVGDGRIADEENFSEREGVGN